MEVAGEEAGLGPMTERRLGQIHLVRRPTKRASLGDAKESLNAREIEAHAGLMHAIDQSFRSIRFYHRASRGYGTRKNRPSGGGSPCKTNCLAVDIKANRELFQDYLGK